MSEPLDLHFPDCLATDFAAELPAARAAVDRIVEVLGRDFDTLERHSPALQDNDWANYLRCSIARMVHAAGALRRAGVSSGRLLDYGSYFGNFAAMFSALGFEVDAIDAFQDYAPALDQPLRLMRERGVRILDYAEFGQDLSGVTAGSYDVIFCGGVIEHMPHTPLGLLTALNHALKPHGHLIIDTPNLAHLYKRQALARGETVWPPLRAQFYSPVPYEGHHREYVAPEVAWMLHEVGHEVLSVELYSYSCYEQAELRGRDVTNFWKMVADPTLREYITTLSRRGNQPRPSGSAPDWRSLLVETEPFWRAAHGAAEFRADQLIESEPLLQELTAAVELRDREIERRDSILAEQQVERNDAVTIRDHTIGDLSAQIASLQGRHDDLQRAFDAKLSEIIKRRIRRLLGR